MLNFCKFLSIVLFLICSISPAKSDDNMSQIQADWQRQEKAAGRWLGSPESIRAAIARGRALADEKIEKGNKEIAVECLKVLTESAEQLVKLEKLDNPETVIDIL